MSRADQYQRLVSLTRRDDHSARARAEADFIRKVRETWKTPAIALIDFGMQEDIERSQKAGFDAHLTKPVNLPTLEATMWRLLQDRP
jgi:CheY-like chemotaxis protein